MATPPTTMNSTSRSTSARRIDRKSDFGITALQFPKSIYKSLQRIQPLVRSQGQHPADQREIHSIRRIGGCGVYFSEARLFQHPPAYTSSCKGRDAARTVEHPGAPWTESARSGEAALCHVVIALML